MTTLEQMMQEYESDQMEEVRAVAVRVLAALLRKEPYETPEQMEAVTEKAWRLAGMFFYVEAKVTGVLPKEDDDE